MSEIDSSAIKEALKISKDLNEFGKKYGKEALATILESVGGFFGLVAAINPEAIDTQELVQHKMKKNGENIIGINSTPVVTQKSNDLIINSKENQKSSSVNTSIYSQNPEILAKVEEDKISHPNLSTKEDESNLTNPSNSELLYTDKERESAEEKPLIKVLEERHSNNPWSGIGEPVSPGNIKF